MAASSALAVSAAGFAGAQTATYPTRPVRLISPFPPGGSVDLVARMVAAKLSDTFLYSRVPYDVLNDFAPVSLLTSSPSLLAVHPSLPARSVLQGGGPGIAARISGEVGIAFTNFGETSAYAKAGRLRALGASGAKRVAAMPEIPTIAEAGLPGYEFVTLRAE